VIVSAISQVIATAVQFSRARATLGCPPPPLPPPPPFCIYYTYRALPRWCHSAAILGLQAPIMALLSAAELEEMLETYGVPGVSMAVVRPGAGSDSDCVVVPQVAGLSSKDPAVPMFSGTWLEIASLSKTFAAAFCIE
jgi:CubicO group peptidase (beta-lactamase class C family)